MLLYYSDSKDGEFMLCEILTSLTLPCGCEIHFVNVGGRIRKCDCVTMREVTLQTSLSSPVVGYFKVGVL